MGCLRIGCLGVGVCAIVSIGLVMFILKPELRSTSISPDGKHIVSVLASPMLFAMPGGGSDASGEMKLMDAAGQELNRRNIEMIQLAAITWSKDSVTVGMMPETWTLPPVKNINILLFSAAYTGNELSFNKLLAQGANIQFVTTFGQTLLHAAVVGKNDKIFQQILQKNVVINAIDISGQTALHLGAGQSETMVKSLVDRGANLNIIDQHGRTPLTVAAAHGHHHNVQFLINRGADINLTNSYETPLWAVISNVKPSPAKLALVKLLLDSGAKITPGLLHNNKDSQVVELLKQHGAEDRQLNQFD
jgi:Ankyrin repeats (3 copies)/Ankyrin repeats (many copies)